MKRATIEDLQVVDQLAEYYIAKNMGDTIMLIFVTTRGAHAEEVNLHQLFTTAKICQSRHGAGGPGVLFTAFVWRELREGKGKTSKPSSPGREEEKPSSDRKV